MCPRPSAGPFQQVVLSTLADTLSGSELFGHVIGVTIASSN